MKLWDALGLSQSGFPKVIALVGSGGKTSLIGQLAKEGKEHHLRVAVTTTTHIQKPPVYQETFSHIEKGEIAIFGSESGEEKICYPKDACYREICESADLILVEADGSRGLPLKCPAEYEPVVPENANVILCVAGMSGLGGVLNKVCHRWELAERSAETVVDEEAVAELLETGYGKMLVQKYPSADFYYCLNQADTHELYEAAERILGRTGRKGILLSLEGKENILYKKRKAAFIYMASGFGRRYGSNKLLAQMEGKELYRYGMETLHQAAEELRGKAGMEVELIVVSQYEEILKSAEELQAVPIYNPDSQDGITASIHLGIRAAEDADAYLFAVADQPWLRTESIQKLVEEFYKDGSTIICLNDGTRNGNPVVFSGKYREELMELAGDKGGSVIMKRYPKEVRKVLVEEKELRDIDIPE